MPCAAAAPDRGRGSAAPPNSHTYVVLATLGYPPWRRHGLRVRPRSWRGGPVAVAPRGRDLGRGDSVLGSDIAGPPAVQRQAQIVVPGRRAAAGPPASRAPVAQPGVSELPGSPAPDPGATPAGVPPARASQAPVPAAAAPVIAAKPPAATPPAPAPVVQKPAVAAPAITAEPPAAPAGGPFAALSQPLRPRRSRKRRSPARRLLRPLGPRRRHRPRSRQRERSCWMPSTSGSASTTTGPGISRTP